MSLNLSSVSVNTQGIGKTWTAGESGNGIELQNTVVSLVKQKIGSQCCIRQILLVLKHFKCFLFTPLELMRNLNPQ